MFFQSTWSLWVVIMNTYRRVRVQIWTGKQSFWSFRILVFHFASSKIRSFKAIIFLYLIYRRCYSTNRWNYFLSSESVLFTRFLSKLHLQFFIITFLITYLRCIKSTPHLFCAGLFNFYNFSFMKLKTSNLSSEEKGLKPIANRK